LTADIATQVVARTRPGQRQYDSLLAFFLASELTADQFAGIADALTVVEGDYMEGLVNVNAASATVLACLPGMDEQAAERVVSYRTIHAESEDFRSVAWLAEVLSQDQAMGIGPHVTTKTYQCSADIVAVGEGNRGCQRVFLVFDTSGEEVRTVYHRSRSALGWALGDDLREAMRP
ncbi:MAG: general secretion pathway protein GspK, partial [Lentisphaeria bacterium]|nr:general secretion pathway protein GspK [Lentisphaeria bacterium]